MANNTKALAGLLILGLILRLTVIQIPGFTIDMGAWAGWAQRLNQVGFSNFYSDQIWTNYTPGYLYILFLLEKIKQIFQIDNSTFLILLKIPSIFAETVLGIITYKLVLKYSHKWALISSAFILLNPAFIFNSSIWGQIDGLFSLFLFFSIYFLKEKRLSTASIFLGISLILKPQTLLLSPVIILFLFHQFTIKNLFNLFAPGLFLVIIFSLPFFVKTSPTQMGNLILQMMQDYPYTSLFAFNFWGIFGFWVSDLKTLFNLSYQNIGYISYFIYWLAVGYFYFKKRISLWTLAALACLSFFFLPTRIHERYLYPGLVFLIISSVLLKSYSLIIMVGLLSIIHLLNLYFVYVYYNEIFLNTPKILYNPFIYSFIERGGKNLSILSLIIFIFITFVTIKTHYVTKKD